MVSKLQRSKLSYLFPIDILGNFISPSDSVRNLGVIFDSGFSFSKQVNSIRKSCYYHIRDFTRIRRYLPKSASISLANALVSSRLDYCNSLLNSISEYDLRRLQGIQNTLCRIVTRASRYSSITPHLKSLHWLPVRYRIKFKQCLLIFKYLLISLPPYFSYYLSPYTCSVNTRRSNPVNNYLYTMTYDYKVHTSKRQFDSSFSVDGTTSWNMLPFQLRSALTVHSFRRQLKGHLFNIAFPP